MLLDCARTKWIQRLHSTTLRESQRFGCNGLDTSVAIGIPVGTPGQSLGLLEVGEQRGVALQNFRADFPPPRLVLWLFVGELHSLNCYMQSRLLSAP